jgi:hypothetical protein
VLGFLRAGDVDPQAAAWFVDVVFLYVNAAALETSIYVEEGTTAEAQEEVHETFKHLDPEQYPNMAALATELTSGTGDERFAFGLRLMIDGLGGR